MRQWQISTVSENKERLIKAAIESCIWAIITRSVFLVNVENITPVLLNVELEARAVKICSDGWDLAQVLAVSN